MKLMNLNYLTPDTLKAIHNDLLAGKNSLAAAKEKYSPEGYKARVEELNAQLYQVSEFYRRLTGDYI